MSAHEFLFSLQLVCQDTGDTMLEDLVANVLEHVGCGGDAVGQLVDEMRRVLAAGAACDRCDVRFRAHAGTLHIVVAHGDREWQTTRPLP